MHADELRRELHDLADEGTVHIESVDAVMRRGRGRVARRRIGMTAAALIVVIGVVGVVARGRNSAPPAIRVQPTTTPTTVAPVVPAAPSGPFVSSATGDIVFTSPTTGWVCGDPVLHTGNGGSTWQAVRQDEMPPDVKSQVCATVPGDDLWSVVGGRPAYVLNVQGGSDLSGYSTYPALPPPGFVIAQETFSDVEHGWILARPASGNGAGVLYRSTETGLRFAIVSHDAPANGVVFTGPTEGWGIDGNDRLEHSVDAGKTWRVIPAPIRTPQQSGGLALANVSAAGNTLVVEQGNDRTAFPQFFAVSLDDGRTWTRRNGPLVSPLGSLSVVDATHWRIATSDQVWITDDSGSTWTKRLAPPGRTTAISFPTPDNGWALTDGHVFETTDGARSWHAVDTTPQPDWHLGLAGVPNGCPSEPVTPPPTTGDQRAAAIRAARAFVLRTRGWTTETLVAAYKVSGTGGGTYGSIFEFNVPKYCGRAVTDATYGVELYNQSIGFDNSRDTALVVGHFAGGWRVWGDYR